MTQGFKKDFFSKSEIKWNSDIQKTDLDKINSIVKNNINSDNFLLERNSGMEINSNNFRLSFNSRKFILKRWSKKIQISKINKILEIITWLNKKKVKTPIAKQFKNKKKIIKYKNEYWSYFDYIEGNHFKGEINEMRDVANNLGKFSNQLKKYSIKKINKRYRYYTKDDANVLKFLKKNSHNLNNFFSKKHSLLIEKNLPEIMRLFNNLKKKKLSNKSHIIHMDIHPHNIITKNGKLKAFIDIDSCVVGDVSQSLSYAALKICKQTFIFNKKKENIKNIKMYFLNEIKKTYKYKQINEDNFYFFAISEVIRRLIEMFRFTIKNNNKRWNHVIPIQIDHLNECKAIFKK